MNLHSLLHTLFVDARVVVLFAIVLGIMVLIHEFGHFAVAKLCGVRIEVFSIGFGKRLFGYTARNGTDYRIAALPLGGYVKMAGELGGDPGAYQLDPNHTPDPGDFNSKTRFQRILIALAGPAANFVLSFFLMALAAHYHHAVDKYRNAPATVDYVPQGTSAALAGLSTGDTIVSFNGVDHPTWNQVFSETLPNLNGTVPFSFQHNGQLKTSSLTLGAGEDPAADPLNAAGIIPREQFDPITIATVAGNTPADRAGLHAGDQIVRMDNIQPHSLETLHAYLKDRNGAPDTVEVVRDGQPQTFHLVAELVGVDKTKYYQIGVTLKPIPVDIVQLPIGEAIKESISDNASKSLLLVRILQGLFTRHVSVKQMSGPVGIAQQIDMAFQIGPWSLVEMTSFISINLAIFNLLPFPPLDGGMIFFLLIESLIRRDVNQQLKERVYQIAFVCIICMFVFVMFNDISRLHLGR